MAEIVNPSVLKRNLGRKQSYPWDEWLDGNCRKLVQGKDFGCALNSLAILAYAQANKRGLQAVVSQDKRAGVVYLQAQSRSGKDEQQSE